VDSYYEVATAYGRQSPEAAADWAIGPIGKNSQSAVLAAVVDIWLGADPMAASAWVGRLEDPALKTTASVRVVEYLLRLREIEDARRWIEVIPDSNARQDIRERYSLE
jgi:hypothetical protein